MINLTVEVFNGNIEGALKIFKKLALKGGLFKEMKKRTYYEKPSLKKKRKQIEASRRQYKAQRQQREYDQRHADD